MPDTRIGTAEAAKIIGCSLTHARRLMRFSGVDIQRVPRDDGGTRLLFLKSDVEACAFNEKSFDREQRPSKADETRKLVEWANKLRRWPTDKAIRSRTSVLYHVKDVEGVIDTRVFRKKADGKYFRALREPAMKRENSILGG